MSWSSRLAVVIVVIPLYTATAEATTYVSLDLYQEIQRSDAIVLGTVMDAQHGIVRVDETLKGETDGSIHLVEYVDTFSRVEDRRPLVTGTRELLFLEKKDQGYAPLQTQYGRWPVRNGRVDAPEHIERMGLPDFRRTIGQLIRLLAAAERGAADAMRAYEDGLQSPDPHVRLWAAHTAYQRVRQPTPALVDAYLKLWPAGNGELRGETANAVIAWKVGRAAPMLATTLREGAEPERATAARALGGTGRRSFLPQLRAAAASDQSERVRGYSYEGLTHLLAGDSIPDLLNGAKDPSVFVRAAVASHAFNMALTSGDAGVVSGTRRVLLLLSGDSNREVQHTARSLLKRLDSLR